jgi:hypothetical protein
MDKTDDKVKAERFRMPSSKELIEISILFNDGEVDKQALASMVGMCQLVVDRLYENGDILIPSTKENDDEGT